MRSSNALPPLFLLLVPSLLGCSPAVDVLDVSSDQDAEIQDAADFVDRDDDIYRELAGRCDCSTDVYERSTWRLQFLRHELEIMGITVDGDCAQAVLEALESPGCELDGPLPECRVFVGAQEVGESCTQGVWLDDCAPSLFCLTSAAGFPAEGTCVERAALGSPCESRPHACADGICIDGVCEAEATEAGDPCWLDCSGGLICAEGVCREPGKCEVIPGSRI